MKNKKWWKCALVSCVYPMLSSLCVISTSCADNTSKLIINYDDISKLPIIINAYIDDIYAIKISEIQNIYYQIQMSLVDVIHNSHSNYLGIDDLLPNDFLIASSLREGDSLTEFSTIKFDIFPANNSTIFATNDWHFEYQTTIHASTALINLSTFNDKYVFNMDNNSAPITCLSFNSSSISSQEIDNLSKSNDLVTYIQQCINMSYPNEQFYGINFLVSFYKHDDPSHYLTVGDNLSSSGDYDATIQEDSSSNVHKFKGFFTIKHIFLKCQTFQLSFSSGTVLGVSDLLIKYVNPSNVPKNIIIDSLTNNMELEDLLTKNIYTQIIKNDHIKRAFLEQNVNSFLNEFDIDATFTNEDLQNEKILTFNLSPKTASFFTNGCQVKIATKCIQNILAYTTVQEEYKLYVWNGAQKNTPNAKVHEGWGAHTATDLWCYIRYLKVSYKVNNLNLKNFMGNTALNNQNISSLGDFYNDTYTNFSNIRSGNGLCNVRGSFKSGGNFWWDGWEVDYNVEQNIKGLSGNWKFAEKSQSGNKISCTATSSFNIPNILYLKYNGDVDNASVRSTIYSTVVNNRSINVVFDDDNADASISGADLVSRNITWSDN